MMTQTLPEEVQELLIKITEGRGEISGKVEQILLKLWQGQALTERERDLDDLTPAEVAAIWSVTHRRPIAVSAVRQATLRRTGSMKGPIVPSKEWGTGPTRRRLYRLGDIVEVRLREHQLKSNTREAGRRQRGSL
jgi:hypothetical protein